jgi:hypothetical protein
MSKELTIRNSTADFLIFTRQNGEEGIAVRIEDENVWLRAEAIAELFSKDRRTIQEHLRNIFTSGELHENSVCRKFRHTAEAFAESEFEKYRIIQDRIYESDFDKMVNEMSG